MPFPKTFHLFFRLSADLMILVATLLMPICMAIIPFCKALWLLAVVLAVMGLNMGCIDCLANVQMIKTFGESVTPFLQVRISIHEGHVAALPILLLILHHQLDPQKCSSFEEIFLF
jgi:hypothetical protein